MVFRAIAVGLSLVAATTGVFAGDVPGTTLSAPGGRFAYGQVGPGRVDQYMLDTQTGRLWQMQCAKKGADPYSCEINVLVPILFSENGSFVIQPSIQQPTPTPTAKH